MKWAPFLLLSMATGHPWQVPEEEVEEAGGRWQVEEGELEEALNKAKAKAKEKAEEVMDKVMNEAELEVLRQDIIKEVGNIECIEAYKVVTPNADILKETEIDEVLERCKKKRLGSGMELKNDSEAPTPVEKDRKRKLRQMLERMQTKRKEINDKGQLFKERRDARQKKSFKVINKRFRNKGKKRAKNKSRKLMLKGRGRKVRRKRMKARRMRKLYSEHMKYRRWRRGRAAAAALEEPVAQEAVEGLWQGLLAQGGPWGQVYRGMHGHTHGDTQGRPHGALGHHGEENRAH